MPQVLVGADPELFMRNPNNGEFVSAHDKIPGTKYEPFKVPFGAIQVDGTALEFNIDPAATAKEFVDNIKAVRKTLEAYVPGYNVVAEPVAVYDERYWFVEVPPEAQTLGCDPDYNAWLGEQNPGPNPGGKPIRTASGHVHIGWTDGEDVYDANHFAYCCRVARQMDYYLGIHSLLWDKDNRRRELYGQAGAFRPKPYGCEYRVLSNRWLDNDALIEWVYNAVQAGMQAANNGNWLEDKYGKLAQRIINENMVNWPKDFPLEFPGLEPLPEGV